MSRARVVRFAGHPLHAALTDLPIGLLVTTPLWDTAALVTQTPALAGVGHWCLLGGLIAAGVTALVGIVDLVWLSESSPPRAAMNHALWHAGAAVTAVTLFLWAYLLRRDSPESPGVAVLVLEWVGFALLGGAGWFGGHLVFHHGIGVEPHAAGSARAGASETAGARRE